LEDDTEIPVLGELYTESGEPLLWIIEALPGLREEADQDPLACRIQPEQLTSLGDVTSQPLAPHAGTEAGVRGNNQPPDWNKRLGHGVFTQTTPPRWVILAGPRQWLLADRAKFARHRLLRFDWVELFTRREDPALKAASVLLHRDSLLE